MADVLSTQEFSPPPNSESNVTILSNDGGQLNLHSCMLQMHSKVFDAALSSDEKNREPMSLAYSFETLKTFFSCLGYCGKPSKLLTQQNAADIANLAHKYDCPDLTELCVDYITKHISSLSAFPTTGSIAVSDVLPFAHLMQNKELHMLVRFHALLRCILHVLLLLMAKMKISHRSVISNGVVCTRGRH